MNDNPQDLRRQIEETKSNLSDKLESLEAHISQTVQATGTAVSETVGAVSDTVKTVTGAVQSAVQCASNALDVGRHFDRHPWLVLGGAAVVGYMGGEFLASRARRKEQQKISANLPCQIVASAEQLREIAGANTAALADAIVTAHDSDVKRSPPHQLKALAIRLATVVVQEIASRVVPLVAQRLANDLAGDPTDHLEEYSVSNAYRVRR
jgi:ElaB/YqjD/DUF883 family membrane-anchored ribosome-binding protein